MESEAQHAVIIEPGGLTPPVCRRPRDVHAAIRDPPGLPGALVLPQLHRDARAPRRGRSPKPNGVLWPAEAAGRPNHPQASVRDAAPTAWFQRETGEHTDVLAPAPKLRSRSQNRD